MWCSGPVQDSRKGSCSGEGQEGPEARVVSYGEQKNWHTHTRRRGNWPERLFPVTQHGNCRKNRQIKDLGYPEVNLSGERGGGGNLNWEGLVKHLLGT